MPTTHQSTADELHADLRIGDSLGAGLLVIGLLGLAFAGGIGWLAVGAGKGVWADLATGHAALSWDWIIGAAMVVVFFVLAAAVLVGAVMAICVWVSGLMGKLDGAERSWAQLATAVEATATATRARIRIVKSSWGGGVTGGIPRNEFQLEVLEIEGAAPGRSFPGLSVRKVGVFDSAWQETTNLSDGSTADDRLAKLCARHPGDEPPVKIPDRRLGSRSKTAALSVRIKIDDAAHPRVIIIEADGLRLWCSGGTTT